MRRERLTLWPNTPDGRQAPNVTLLDFESDRLAEFAAQVRAEYDDLKAKNLKLDLTRGKPSSEQLDFAEPLLSLPGEGEHQDADGADVRNYGNLKGISDIRTLWAEVIGVDPENLIARDASSLNIMFDLITWSYMFGNNDSERPWKDLEGDGEKIRVRV